MAKAKNFFEVRRSWQAILASERPHELEVAVLATFTSDLLVPCLGTALEDAGLPARVWNGPYNQVVQECLDRESKTAAFDPDYLVVCPRLEELWSGRPHRDALYLADACRDAAERWSAGLVFVLPPIPEERPLGLGDAGDVHGVAATATAIREALRLRLAGHPGILLVDLEETVRKLGSDRAYKPAMLVYAHIPFTEELFMALGERIAQLLRLARKGRRQVLVVDGDDTLWGGSLRQLGAEGVELVGRGNPLAHRELQAYLLECRRAGLKLILVSSAKREQLEQVLERPEMRLVRSHFTAIVPADHPVTAKLEAIARQIGLELDVMALLAAGEETRSEVARELPRVALLAMPEDPAFWLGAIQASHVLSSLPEPRQSRDDSGASPSLEEFLRSLELEVSFVEMGAEKAPRIVEMLEGIPELNLAAASRSADEIADELERRAARIWEIRVRDRFDDYGAAGLCRSSIDGQTLEVDTLALNCRALGKRVEAHLVRDLAATATKEDLSALRFFYQPTPRNEPALDFLKKIDTEGLRQWEDGWVLELPVARAAEWARRRLEVFLAEPVEV